MKKFLLSALAVTTVVAAGAKSKAPADPVLMTVDGVPVTVSEFEYLYHKNNDQQVEQQSLDEYLEMFKVYKLKVAEARHQRVDTAATFQKEFAGYRAELVAPYLRDAAVEQQLVDDAYAHMLEQVQINHMMVADRHLADSLRAVLVANPDRFLNIAQTYSTDPSLRQNGGRYGWVSAGQYPYEFEEGVYNTPVGEISEVIDTRFGHHIVQVLARRDNPGEISARHILLSFPPTGRSAESEAALKVRIDSIYNELKAGADFGDMARKVSTCPSGSKGGELGWFGAGRMVPEFENAAFALADGEISEPFTTQFGWHIVQRTGSRGVEPKEKLEKTIRQAIGRDGRLKRAIDAKAKAVADVYGAKILTEGRQRLVSALDAAGSFEKAVDLASDKTPLIQVGDSIVTIAEFMTPVPRLAPGVEPSSVLDEILNDYLNEVVLTYEDHRLESKYPELRNIVNEYRDGMMLFEVSNQNVWDVPASNPALLEEYFNAHKEKYATWEEPRFKGYVIYATSDSLIQEVDKYLAENHPAASEVGDKLKEALPRNIKIERVVLPKGKNAIVDYLGFGGEAPDLSNERRWVAYTSYLGHVIDQPEEAADCRAAVSSDYQQELEKQWVETLREKYPITVNQKVLKKVK